MTVTHHTSHSFSYLSSLPLVTDPIAVASNDCAIDRLHKDCCAQAFGRNTLSKPHIDQLSDAAKAKTQPHNDTMIINEPVKPVAGSSKHPDNRDVIDSELIY